MKSPNKRKYKTKEPFCFAFIRHLSDKWKNNQFQDLFSREFNELDCLNGEWMIEENETKKKKTNDKSFKIEKHFSRDDSDIFSFSMECASGFILRLNFR